MSARPANTFEDTPIEDDGFDVLVADDGTKAPPPLIRRTDAPATKPPRKPLTLKPFIFAAKLIMVVGIILAYPVATMMSHQVDDSVIDLDGGRYWAAGDIGVSVTLLSRELEGPGWAADRHPWHPQAQLTALPAWQEGLRASITDHARLTLSTLSGQRDDDLVAAERLLKPDAKLKTTPRLQAARQALIRYDDRVGRGVAGSPQGLDFLKRELEMTLGWAQRERLRLADISTPGDGWLASREAVSITYHAKAHAHAANQLLGAIAEREADTLAGHPAEQAMALALQKWRSAAKLKPLFISNQGDDGLVGANHPAILAFRLDEAHTATSAVIALLEAEPFTDPSGEAS